MSIDLLMIISLPIPIIFLIYAFIKLARQEGFFVPIPHYVIEEMLKMTNIESDDLLYDLGSGNGVVLITAVKQYGLRAVGIEDNRFLSWLSRQRVEKLGLRRKISIVRGNFFHHDLSGATIVYGYLTQKLTDKIKGKLERELKKGTRVLWVSYKFPGWRVAKEKKVGHYNLYLYKI